MSDKPRLDKIYQQKIMLALPATPPRVKYHTQQAINSVVANLGLTAEQLANIKIISDGEAIGDKIYIGIILAWVEPCFCDVGEFLWQERDAPGAAFEIKVLHRDKAEWRRYLKRLLLLPRCNIKTPPHYYWERVI